MNGFIDKTRVSVRVVTFVIAAIIGIVSSGNASIAATASDVAALVKAGLQEDVVLAKVEAEGLSGTMSVDDLVTLKAAGISAAGIKRLLALEALGDKRPPVGPKFPPTGVQPVSIGNDLAQTTPSQPASVQPVYVQTQPLPAQGVLSYGPVVTSSYMSPYTSLVISNRNAHAISVTVDAQGGVIYCSRAFHGDPRSIMPMRSASYTVPAGDYIIVVEGNERIMFVHMTPGSADLLIMNARGYSSGYEFVLSQNGRRIYAVQRAPEDCYRRKIFVSIPVGRHGKIVLVREESIDPISIFLGRGWKWPGHHGKSHKYDNRDKGTHDRNDNRDKGRHYHNDKRRDRRH